MMNHLSTRKREHGQEVHPGLMLFGTPKQRAWLSKGLRGKNCLQKLRQEDSMFTTKLMNM